MSTNPQRDEIIRRMDLLAEFQKYGGRVPPNAQVSPDGWIPVHSIDREDEHPSAALNIGNDPSKRGVYVDHAPTGKGVMSIFDALIRLPISPWMMGKEAHRHYAAVTGVDGGSGAAKREKIAPTMADVEGFQKNFAPETKDFLRDKRGLTEASLAKYRIGWCLKRQRNSIPVFDENGKLVNIRFHNSK